MQFIRILAALIALACTPAVAQVTPGSGPLTGAKGGTNNAFMQFTGPASSLKTYTLPNSSDTIATLGAIQTFSAAKTFNSATLLLAGSSSGSTTLNASAAASGTLTLPAATDTLVARNTTDTLTNKTLTSPTLTTPALGVATATSINKVAITAPATSATLTIPDGVTLTGPASSGTAMTLGNAETVTGVKTFGSSGAVGRLRIAGTTSGSTILDATAVASGTLTLPAATDTLVGKATADTLTNKTFDTAGTGNSFSINGLAATANTGTGSVVRATSPTLTTPILGVASATTINKVTITAPASGSTLTIPDGVTLTGPAASGTAMTLGNAETVSGAKSFNDATVILKGSTSGTTTLKAGATAGSTTVTLPVATDTLVGKATTDTLTNKTFDTQGTGNVFTLNGAAFGTATQATAALNAMVGDSGSGGTKGLVPAPSSGDGAAAKFLKADGTWAVPAGGGGGSLSDTDRQNILLESIYQAKSFGGYRRHILRFSDGFADSGGINAGSSSNYTVTSSPAASANVAPTTTAETTTLIAFNAAGSTNVGNMTGGAGIAAAFDNTTSQAAASSARLATAGVIQWVGKDYGSGNSHRIGRFRVFGPNNATLSGGGGTITVRLYGSNVSTGPTSPQDGVQISSGSNANTTAEVYDVTVDSVTAYRWIWVTISTTGNAAPPDAIIAEAQFYDFVAGTANNMTLVTTSQTADSTVTNGRVLLEYDNTATPTLNTDLTAEVTCNGGTNWASASLSAVTSNSQGGRKVAESVDQSCGANTGTSFAARIKTLNNKLVPVYGVSLTAR